MRSKFDATRMSRSVATLPGKGRRERFCYRLKCPTRLETSLKWKKQTDLNLAGEEILCPMKRMGGIIN
jgi:hypothetical protein